MRRSRGDQASAFSLFPFLAVLLCTMGALVVLLVAMAHVSRAKAEEDALQAQAERHANQSTEQRLAESELRQAREQEAAEKKRQQQARRQLEEAQQELTGIEDHVRRMQDEVELLRAEAMELFALEEAKFDDQEVAERELERLEELAEQLKSENLRLEEEVANRERRYAIVPMRDSRTGTHRPAIYLECREEGILLQPEGILLTRADLAPPVKVSSPLAAAVRAIEQFYRDHPEARATSESGAPYPLMVVRPDGISAYFRARTVLESVGSEYGYQPVAEAWPLEYDPPNPILAERVAKAIDLARIDRQRLSIAAPELFAEGLGGWEGAPRELPTGGGAVQNGAATDNPFAGVTFVPSVGGTGSHGEQQEGAPNLQGSDSSSAGTGESSASSGAAFASSQAAGSYSPGAEGAVDDPSSSALQHQPGGAAGGAAEGSGSMSPPPTLAEASASAMASPQAGPANHRNSDSPGTSSGPQRAGIAMLRTVRLSIDAYQLVIQEEGNTISSPIDLRGEARLWMPQLLAALKRHADTWGIAGDGMYWKSRVLLDVAPDAQSDARRQAVQVKRHLESAGIEVQPLQMANQSGGAHASQTK